MAQTEPQRPSSAPDLRGGVIRAPSTTFTDALPVRDLARTVIQRWHPHLAASDIRYLFRQGGAWMTGGKTILGKVAKLGTQQQFLAEGADAVILIDEERWEKLDEAQRLALVDHECAHLVQATDKDECPLFQDNGRPVLRVRAHDVEEFVEVIQRHGLWDIDLVHAGKAIRQIPLPLNSVREEPGDASLGDDTHIELSSPDGRSVSMTGAEFKSAVTDLAARRGRRRGGAQ